MTSLNLMSNEENPFEAIQLSVSATYNGDRLSACAAVSPYNLANEKEFLRHVLLDLVNQLVKSIKLP